MLDTTAFAICKRLKAAGYSPVITDAPKGRPPMADAEHDDLAVISEAPLDKGGIAAFAGAVRLEVRKTCDAYTIDSSGKCKHYPKAVFAAW